jgi:phosphoenolpyruvate synthase/pyruvate phosphate dikinase
MTTGKSIRFGNQDGESYNYAPEIPVPERYIDGTNGNITRQNIVSPSETTPGLEQIPFGSLQGENPAYETVYAPMPIEMEKEILEAYEILDTSRIEIAHAKKGALDILRNSHEPPFVAVRSSATAEDLADASFAGQQESFLNVKGNKELIKKVKDCFASLFTGRAVYYRIKKGFDYNKVNLAVVVQRMIDSEKSGVMFSTNPVKNNNTIVIEAVWGLGEGIVSGQIKPDHYEINRDINLFKVQKLLETKSILRLAKKLWTF